MPRIQRIMPKERTITSQAVSPTRRTTGKGTEVQMLGKTVADIGALLARTNLIAEKTRAENQFDSTMLDIKGRASQDQDISAKNQARYDSEISKAKTDAGKMISIPAERSFFELQKEPKENIYKIQVKDGFTKKVREQQKIDFEAYLTNKDIKESDKQWKQGELNHDISADPEYVLENIKEYGLTAKEERAASELARSLIKSRGIAQERAGKEADIKAGVDLYTKVIQSKDSGGDGSELLREIADAESRGLAGLPGGISQKLAKNLMKRVTGGGVEPTQEEKDASFIALQDRYTDLDTDKDSDNPTSIDVLQQFKADVISEKSKGLIKDKYFERWTEVVAGTLEERQKRKSGWETIKEWVIDTHPPVMVARTLAKMGQALIGGDGGVKEAKKIIEETKKQEHPEWNDLEINDTIPTPDGRKWKIIGFLPDGEPDLELIK